jgi:hypothetical protein
MKNFLFLLLAAFMVACSGPEIDKGPQIGELLQDSTGNYSMLVLGIDGQDSTRNVNFKIDSKIVDSLKLADSIIKNLCEISTAYADFNVKNERSYRFRDKSSNIVLLSDDGFIYASISGIAANNFGVEGNISSMIKFHPNGELVKEGEYDLPVIYTFD